MPTCRGRGLRKSVFATPSEFMKNVFRWAFVFTGGLLLEAAEALEERVYPCEHTWTGPGCHWSTQPQIMLQGLHWIFSSPSPLETSLIHHTRKHLRCLLLMLLTHASSISCRKCEWSPCRNYSLKTVREVENLDDSVEIQGFYLKQKLNLIWRNWRAPIVNMTVKAKGHNMDQIIIVKKVVESCTLQVNILRESIIDTPALSGWPPTANDIRDSAQQLMPPQLLNFLAWSTGSADVVGFDNCVDTGDDVRRKLLYVVQDICIYIYIYIYINKGKEGNV